MPHCMRNSKPCAFKFSLSIMCVLILFSIIRRRRRFDGNSDWNIDTGRRHAAKTAGPERTAEASASDRNADAADCDRAAGTRHGYRCSN